MRGGESGTRMKGNINSKGSKSGEVGVEEKR